jgi:hypothetical protein
MEFFETSAGPSLPRLQPTKNVSDVIIADPDYFFEKTILACHYLHWLSAKILTDQSSSTGHLKRAINKQICNWREPEPKEKPQKNARKNPSYSR